MKRAGVPAAWTYSSFSSCPFLNFKILEKRRIWAARASPAQAANTPGRGNPPDRSSYLVDPASSHMLVSKIKPCMSKYKLVSSETADGSLNQLWFIGSSPPDMDNCGNSRANTCVQAPTFQKACFY